MNSCYRLVDVLEKFAVLEGGLALNGALDRVFPGLTPTDARIRFLNMFSDAIEDMGKLSHIGRDGVDDLSRHIKLMQGNALSAVAQENVQAFLKAMRHTTTSEKLRDVGHILAVLRVPEADPVDRDVMQDTLLAWIPEIEGMDLPQIQKSILLAKMRSLVRFLVESRGATNAEVLRRLKSLAADLSGELKGISDENRSTLQRLRDAVVEPIKNTFEVLNITSDALSAATALGPIAIAVFATQDPPLALPAPEAPVASSISAPTEV